MAKFIAKLLEYNNNNYADKLKDSKKLFYDSIYNLKLIKLEISKIYIKINVTNSFI